MSIKNIYNKNKCTCTNIEKNDDAYYLECTFWVGQSWNGEACHSGTR